MVRRIWVLRSCCLKHGISSLAEVIEAMGQPTMVWNTPDCSKQLAYPRVPAGTHNFMVLVGSETKKPKKGVAPNGDLDLTKLQAFG